METSSTQQDLSRLFESASGYFALLSEPMRLRILHAICDHERTVKLRQAGDTGAEPARLAERLREPRWRRLFNRASGAVFVAFGGVLLRYRA